MSLERTDRLLRVDVHLQHAIADLRAAVELMRIYEREFNERLFDELDVIVGRVAQIRVELP